MNKNFYEADVKGSNALSIQEFPSTSSHIIRFPQNGRVEDFSVIHAHHDESKSFLGLPIGSIAGQKSMLTTKQNVTAGIFVAVTLISMLVLGC